MMCVKPIRIYKNLDRLLFPDGLEVPCGKCVACRIAKRKEWSMRMLHELDSWDKAMFLTLTYSDDKLPLNGSLVKKDFQKFIKRLRKVLSYENRKIRYFACGEYGEQSGRPHYHAIIFGLSLDKWDKSLVQKTWKYCDWSVDSIQKKSFGNVEADSIRYVAQYIDKKLSGSAAERYYDERGIEPVFKVSSLGIGKAHILKNAKQYIENQKISMFGEPQSFPRYYLKILGLENSDFRKELSKDKSKEFVEYYTDISDLTFDDAYTALEHEQVKKLVSAKKRLASQKEKNMIARINLKQKKI